MLQFGSQSLDPGLLYLCHTPDTGSRIWILVSGGLHVGVLGWMNIEGYIHHGL